jgi:hypothetical protein
LDFLLGHRLKYSMIIKVPCIAENHVSHSNMKNIELHSHYLRQVVHNDVVSLEYCRTEDQVVDIFTKYLTKVIFINIHTFLGI